MKALITGAGGRLGRELAALLPEAIALDHGMLDVSDETAVWKAFSEKTPEVVFHVAAATDVDLCERNPALARSANAIGTRNIAQVCGSLGIFLVAVSTDYVFGDGAREPIQEDETARPLSVYGRTKFEGEIAVRELAPEHAVVRVSWLYGPGPNFVKRVVLNALEDRPMDMVRTQVSSPTLVSDLAPALLRLAKLRHRGTFHVTNDGFTPRDQWARAILEEAGLDASIIRTVDRVPAPARRPTFSALANTRARALGVCLRPWREALHSYLDTDAEMRQMLRPSP